jgi:hypothetical protein
MITSETRTPMDRVPSTRLTLTTVSLFVRPMSRPITPTDQDIKHAEELELNDEDIVDECERPVTKDDLDKGLLGSSPHPIDPKAIIPQTPREVKSVARIREPSDSSDRPRTPDHVKTSPLSFRSIPASSSKSNINPTRQTVERDLSTLDLNSSPPGSPIHGFDDSRMDTRTDARPESFAEVALEDVASDDPHGGSGLQLQHYQPPFDSIHARADVESTSHAKDTSAPNIQPAKSSFLSSAWGFSRPDATSPSQPTSGLPNQSTSSSTSSPSGSGWKSTMSNLLGNRSTPPTPLATGSDIPPSTPPMNARIPLETPQTSSASTSFLLQRMESPKASRDRRISRQGGAADQLRVGFERVRSAMEGAAREMRREEKAEHSPVSPDSPAAVDWVFWGAVVQDYEEVARSRPKDLSRAIQQGVPHVIR